VQAASGADRHTLYNVAKLALRAWPEGHGGHLQKAAAERDRQLRAVTQQ